MRGVRQRGKLAPVMVTAGDVLKMEPLGLWVEFLRTAQDTEGESLEMLVSGRPRGLFTKKHIHGSQVERLEMVSGAMKVVIDGREHLLEEGESIEVPPGTPHTQTPVGDGPGTVRIEVRPAGRTQLLLEHLASLCREGAIMRSGFPRPVAGAELVLEFGDTGLVAPGLSRGRG
jgi:quercetin dioxygenase-like cupin family protein